MSKVKQTLTSLTKNMTSYVLVSFLVFFVGCAEIVQDDTGNSPWVPASAEIELSLGVSNWYIETSDGGATRIVGYDRSDNQVSEMMISAPIINQIQTLTYELYVTQHTRVVMTENGVIENTLSVEPRGVEWFDAMVNVQSAAKKKSNVNKSFFTCVGLEAGLELGSIVCDLSNGSYGHPADYFSVCMAIYNCYHDRASSYNDNTYVASSGYTDNTGYANNSGYTNSTDTWSSNNNDNNVCYDSWGYVTPCQTYQNTSNSVCYDSWGYEVSCGQGW